MKNGEYSQLSPHFAHDIYISQTCTCIHTYISHSPSAVASFDMLQKNLKQEC